MGTRMQSIARFCGQYNCDCPTLDALSLRG